MTYKNISEWAFHVNPAEIRLHVGCGSKYKPGWCNIDAYPTQKTDTHRGSVDVKPDIWADILALPTAHDTVDLIYSSHVVEHFYRHKAINLFKEFWRVLKPGGFVITEMPDLSRILLLLALLRNPPKYPIDMNANRDVIKAQLYGAAWEANDQGYQCHKYVWERKEFCQMLQAIGYDIILATGATQSHVPFRDMAVICQMPFTTSSLCRSTVNAEDILKDYGRLRARAKKQITSFLNMFKQSVAG